MARPTHGDELRRDDLEEGLFRAADVAANLDIILGHLRALGEIATETAELAERAEHIRIRLANVVGESQDINDRYRDQTKRRLVEEGHGGSLLHINREAV